MRDLIVWQLSDFVKVSIGSITKDLQTITCCDLVDIVLYHHQEAYPILVGLPACELHKFAMMLKKTTLQPYEQSVLHDGITMQQDICQTVLLTFLMHGQLIHHSTQSLLIIQSWIRQLELLHVLMEENEHEKKTRSTSCCGS